MTEIIQLITSVIVFHLILGSLLVLLASQYIAKSRINAATRHSTWLSVLLVLILMPASTLNPFNRVEIPENNPDAVKTQSSHLDTVVKTDFRNALSPQSENAFESTSTAGLKRSFSDMLASVRTIESRIFDVLSSTLGKFALVNWILGLLLCSIVVGAFVKLMVFAIAYIKLQSLFRTSEAANQCWKEKTQRLMRFVGLTKCPSLRTHEAITSPLSCGLFKPWIVLPKAWVDCESVDPEFVNQALIHELAHIKRYDPFVALFQSFISIFTFWHPGINYVNRQIRFERELACDDWVIASSSPNKSKEIKSFATNLLAIATAMPQGAEKHSLSVGCVQSSWGLGARLAILLDRQANHSNRIQSRQYNIFLAVILVFLLISVLIWPAIPVSNAAISTFSNTQLVILETRSQQYETLQTEQGTSTELNDAIINVETADQLLGGGNEGAIQSMADGRSQEPSIDSNSTAITSDSKPVPEPQSTSFTTPDGITDVDSGTAEYEEVGRRELDSTPPAPIASVTPFQEPSAHRQIEISTLRPARSKPSDGFFANAEVPETVVDLELTDVWQPIEGNPNLNRKTTTTQAVNEGNSQIALLDEISKNELLRQIESTEEEFYRVFNSNSIEKSLTIICGKYRPTNSHISHSYCEPKFLIDSRSENMQSKFIHRDFSQVTTNTIVNNNRENFQRLTEEMNALLARNEYFRGLNATLRAMRARLEKIQ
ncbi:MAG: M56 family metallopeptidase [Gammaproteobacteria bacterium]